MAENLDKFNQFWLISLKLVVSYEISILSIPKIFVYQKKKKNHTYDSITTIKHLKDVLKQACDSF